eukprot:3805149-Pleurochrysis_carterae.AAC.2
MQTTRGCAQISKPCQLRKLPRNRAGEIVVMQRPANRDKQNGRSAMFTLANLSREVNGLNHLLQESTLGAAPFILDNARTRMRSNESLQM